MKLLIRAKSDLMRIERKMLVKAVGFTIYQTNEQRAEKKKNVRTPNGTIKRTKGICDDFGENSRTNVY